MVLLLKNLIFTLLVPGTTVVLLPYLILSRTAELEVGGWAWPQWLAVPLAVAGLMIYSRCVWDFARRGRATPAPIDAPEVLVVEGLYQYVRNPMYLGVLLMILSEVIYFRSASLALYLAVWFLFVHLFTILYEEPTLSRRFDGSYEAYRRAVRRWIPGRPFRRA